LGAAIEARDVFVSFLGVDPRWDELRDSPAFRAVLSRANLLEVSDRTRTVRTGLSRSRRSSTFIRHVKVAAG
jgi:hypothetical protein